MTLHVPLATLSTSILAAACVVWFPALATLGYLLYEALRAVVLSVKISLKNRKKDLTLLDKTVTIAKR